MAAGAAFVGVAATFPSVIIYGYTVLDCADIGNIAEIQERPCSRTPNFYLFSVLSLAMLTFGSWLVVAGSKGISPVYR